MLQCFVFLRRATKGMCSALVLVPVCLLLQSCGGSPGRTASLSPTTAPVPPSPTATSNPASFQVVLYEQDTPTACPSGQKTSCLLFQGNGVAVGYGKVTMTRREVLSGAMNSQDCQQATGPGSLSTSEQDQITFTVTGTYCFSNPAHLTYTVTGGMGKYQGASGSGAIMVKAVGLQQGDIEHRSETWNGLIAYPGQS
jgi:hypothetical protein